MTTGLSQLSIRAIAVGDDNRDIRNTISDEIRDAHVEPKPLEGSYQTAEALVRAAMDVADAAIFDHHLRTRNYAACTGAEVVDMCYTKRFPSVLVTKYSKADIDQIRPHLRRIPVLLTPDDAHSDNILKGLELCIEEIDGRFRPSRKPWRTLVRIEDVDSDGPMPILYVIVPAWNSGEVIRLVHGVPDWFRSHARPGLRCYARVNIGAESQDELYFDDFELPGG